MRYIIAKYNEKLSNFITSSLNTKRLYYMQKVIHFSFLKTKVSQVLILCLLGSCFRNLVISIMIDFGAKDHFVYNQDLFSSYTRYKHQFEIEIRQKIFVHSHGYIYFRMNNH